MELEVAPMIVGKAPEGFKVAGIEVFPSQIRVRGPESRIRSRDKLSTSPVDISHLTQTTTVEVDIILPKPNLRLDTSLTKVRVEISIEPTGKAAEGKERSNDRK
jgi:YbbR domain-containing protein